MKEISVYSKRDCKNCDALKLLLEKDNIPFKKINIFTPTAMTELAMNNVVTISAPVLQIGNKFYTTRDFCINNDLNQDTVRSIVSKEFKE